METRYLHVGGLVAVGLDRAERFLLAISHSGRGVFSTDTWDRVARCYEVIYPTDGECVGVGPLAGLSVPVMERYDDRILRLQVAGWDVAADGSGITLTRLPHGSTQMPTVAPSGAGD